jgi:ribosome-associated translation inhibitor RaiA
VSELETQLRRLAANGEFTYLSVIPVAGKGEYGVVFEASVSPASRFGHSQARDADPVAAILKAIEGLPKSMVKEPRKLKEFGNPKAEPEPWDVTA